MTHLEKTKLIDRYLSREMTEKERIDFERLLSEPDSSYNGELSLQKEMELQKDIELAIQERGLREMLQREEERLRAESNDDQPPIEIAASKHRGPLWIIGSVATTAIAASITMMLIIAPVAQQMQSFSNQYVAEVQAGNLRGNNKCAEMLNSALQSMQSDDWSTASATVDDVLRQTADSPEAPIRELHAHAQWLKALCLMHDGKVLKARRLLRQIANSDSPYSEQAAELLKSF